MEAKLDREERETPSEGGNPEEAEETEDTDDT